MRPGAALRAIISFGLAATVMMPAAARGRPVTAAMPCAALGGEPATIAAVNPDFSLALGDGRTLRLVGIDPVRATPTRPSAGEESRGRLSSWLAGRAAVIRLLGIAADRWGRLPALVFAATPADPAALLPVATALVDAGLARARPEAEGRGCWPRLLAAEATARAAGLGLWADPNYAVLAADDLPALQTAMGRMAIVQGRVAHVGESRSRLYIDLGPIHGSLSLRLGRRDAFILEQRGVTQNGLVGLTLRARGVVDDRNGPYMDVTDPDQIEIVERAEPGTESVTRVAP